MKKINFAGMKQRVVEKAKEVCETVKDYADDHQEGIFWGVMLCGLTISYGQSIRYMHLLNKQAKKGTFKFIPGRGYVA